MPSLAVAYTVIRLYVPNSLPIIHGHSSDKAEIFGKFIINFILTVVAEPAALTNHCVPTAEFHTN